jgi:hypothetical protein
MKAANQKTVKGNGIRLNRELEKPVTTIHEIPTNEITAVLTSDDVDATIQDISFVAEAIALMQDASESKTRSIIFKPDFIYNEMLDRLGKVLDKVSAGSRGIKSSESILEAKL